MTRSGLRRGARAPAAILALLLAVPAGAQITLDGTLGPAGALTGPNYAIGAGLGRQVGTNLFHSFGQFNVLTGQSATFSGPASIQNVIGRVTGGSASTIDGTLRSTISGANLFLVNPSGLMFGPNASLDVSGSFHASTASYLTLGTSGRFDAANPAASVLTTAAPSAFGFLGAPAPIGVNGSVLTVPPGQALSLVGGDVTLTGAVLQARAGRINLASLGSAGEVQPAPGGIAVSPGAQGGAIAASGSLLDVDGSAGLPAGRIAIRGGNLVLAGTNLSSSNDSAAPAGGIGLELDGDLAMSGGAFFSWTSGGGAAGDIDVRARNISLLGGAQLEVTTFGAGRGGAITLDAAESIVFSGNDGTFRSGLFNSSDGSGDAGRVFISAPQFTMDGALVSLQSHVGGNAGSLELRAGRVALANGSLIDSTTFATGRGGDIRLDASGSLGMSGRSVVSSGTRGAGVAGSIAVATPLLEMNDSGILSQSTSASTGGSGNGGTVTVRAGRIAMDNGAQLNASTFTAGRGGNLDVSATEAIVITGFNGAGLISGFLSGATFNGIGGTVAVETPFLRVDGGLIGTAGYLSASAGGIAVRAGRIELANGGRIDASTFGSGAGGAVSVAATESISILGARDEAVTDRLLRQFITLVTGLTLPDVLFNQLRPAFGNFSSSGIASRAVFSGSAGPLAISAPGIVVGSGGVISSEARGTGNAGSVTIGAGSSLRLLDGGSITTEALSADGGDIHITARDLVYLRDSRITTSVGTGSGNGGNITIDPTFVVLDNSQIIANAFGGNGGNITIVSDFFLKDPSSLVQASSQLKQSGTITISAPNVDVSAGLAALPSGFFDASLLLRESCAARASRAANSFTGVGRGGLPASPAQLGFGSYAGALAPDAAADNSLLRLANAPAAGCLRIQ